MDFNPAIAKSVEQLNYRVTVGDVAAQAGLNLNLAQQGLLALAADADGHMQVAETGDIVYLFPKNFRARVRNKHWQLRLHEWWQKLWKVLFYLIRVSFGVILIASIALMVVAIAAIVIAINSSRDNDNSSYSNRSYGGGGFFYPRFWFGPDLFWFFSPNYNTRQRQRRQPTAPNQMNFFEAIFSFLFGDGNPNFNLEERRWQEIGTVIRNHDGAVVAEQIAPYLDEANGEDEDYILGVLTRFNGYPEVSPEGEIIYYFPELQVTASRHRQPVPDYLREQPWRFSAAGSTQIMLAIGLGAANVILALVLGSLLQDGIAAQLGGIVAFVASIYWLLLGYGVAFLAIPLIRYFWLGSRNGRIEARNQERQLRAVVLKEGGAALRQKLNYAQQFAARKVIGDEDITYSTETDLLEQELERSDKIDEEWRRRLT